MAIKKQSVAKHTADALMSSIQDHAITVGVIGLGYVGLPIAVEYAHLGVHTIGLTSMNTKSALCKKAEIISWTLIHHSLLQS